MTKLLRTHFRGIVDDLSFLCYNGLMIYTEFPTDKKYNIIYTDPAWTYRDKASAGKRGAIYKYDLMTIEDIKSLPVLTITDTDCILFLWVTFPLLQEGLNTISAWGFEYKTVGFNWVKRNKKSNGWFWGMGRWTRSNGEICLLATRGKPTRQSASVHSVIDERISYHSKKPDIVRDKIVELCGDLPRIELFARHSFEGWDCWGNEIDDKLEEDFIQGTLL